MRLLASRLAFFSSPPSVTRANLSHHLLLGFSLPSGAIFARHYSPVSRLSASPPASSHTTMTISTLGQDWQHVTHNPSNPPFHVYTKPVQKSQLDDREYRVIKLDNGLEAMLIHDHKADKAAASLDVAVGHLNDPVRQSLFSSSHLWR